MFPDRARYFLGILLALPVFPVMYVQAKKLKRDFPRLPDAKNPQGKTEGVDPMRVLMLGESSIAGVGVDDHEQSISGQLSNELSQLTGRSIDWQVVAQSGYTAQQVTEKLVPNIPNQSFDLIIVGLGGNDTFKIHTPWFWKKSMRALTSALHQKHPEAQVVITYMPPVHTFIAFSPLIRFFLGNLTILLGREMKRLAKDSDYLHYFDYVVLIEEWFRKGETNDPSAFFSDGVHPSALTYMLWGQDTARFIHTDVLHR